MKDLHDLYDEPQDEVVLQDEEGSEESTSIFNIIICVLLFFLGAMMTSVDTEIKPPGKVF